MRVTPDRHPPLSGARLPAVPGADISRWMGGLGRLRAVSIAKETSSMAGTFACVTRGLRREARQPSAGGPATANTGSRLQR
jgi:hypothetical protein